MSMDRIFQPDLWEFVTFLQSESYKKKLAIKFKSNNPAPNLMSL